MSMSDGKIAIYGMRTAHPRIRNTKLFEFENLPPVTATYDAENEGLLAYEEEAEQEIEIEINEDEAPFLAGQTAAGGDVSPIKIVKNPDGSLQRAAMTQSALAKERRELKEQQQRTALESIPKDLNRPWEDPMPEAGERHLAAELRGVGLGG